MARTTSVLATGNTDAAVATSGGILVGLAVCATTAAAGAVKVYDNASAASGNVVCTASAAGSSSVFLPIPSLAVVNGLYADRSYASTTGNLEIVAYWM